MNCRQYSIGTNLSRWSVFNRHQQTDATFAKACRGFSATEAAKVLDNASVKLLHKQDVERLKAAFSVCTMAGTKKRRFYAIKDSILKDAESKRSL